MQKPRRNDPCSCGSGKKYKKCCGNDNVIEFHPHYHDEELHRLADKLEGFAFTQYEKDLAEIGKYYLESNVNQDYPDGWSSYLSLLSPWMILNVPLKDGQTIFNHFFAQEQSKIKNKRIKNVFSTWINMEPSVYKVISAEGSTDQPVTLQNMITDETYRILRGDKTYTVGDYMIGILVPYINAYDFIFVTLTIDRQDEDYVIGLLEEMLEYDTKFNDVYPEFAAELMFPDKQEPLEWWDMRHEAVAQLFVTHMTSKGMDDKLIKQGIELWHLYCEQHTPNVKKPATYAGALDYLLQSMFNRMTGVTQAEIAAEYGTTAGTVSNNYRKLADFIEIAFNESELDDIAFSPPSHTDQPPFSPFGIEQEMRNIQEILNNQEFDSDEELQSFLDELLQDGNIPDVPLKQHDMAQDMIEQAYMTHGQEQSELIEQALEMDPNNPDAYVLLADLQKDRQSEQQFLQRAIQAGEDDLGEIFFKENEGHFWGLIETRPYMRAKQAYAFFLEDAGFLEEAVAEYEDLLVLNPNDNQGNRYLLLKLYIEMKNFFAAQSLLKSYDGEMSAEFLFNKALLEYLINGVSKKALKLLKEADEANPYVMKYIIGDQRIPAQTMNYIQPGKDSEAVAYMQGNVNLWADAQKFLQSFRQT